MIKFFIGAAGRDGSTLLCGSLDTHPEIYCAKEIMFKNYFHSQPLNWPAEKFITAEVWDKLTPDKEPKAKGFKLLHGECRPSVRKGEDIRPYLVQINCKVIFLTRKNILKRFLSHELANETKKWHNFNGQIIRDETTTVLPKRLFNFLDASIIQLEKSKEDFNLLDSMQVYYEELISDFDNEINRICNFLGVSQIKINKTMQRLENRPINEIVTNFDELTEMLTGTEHEWMLS